MPGQEIDRELADALEAITQKTDDADECKEHHDQMRKLCTQPLAEAKLDPFRAGRDARAPQQAR